MIHIMGQMAALIGCGVAWQWWRPGGLDPEVARGAITGLVYHLFLPALILSVLWEAPLGTESPRIAAAAALGVLGILGLTWGTTRLTWASRKTIGTLLLAAAFPNVTYLGLPVLEVTFGDWATRIALQYDLFACTPLVLTVGVLIARTYGDQQPTDQFTQTLVRVPPLWAAGLAVGLNWGEVPLPVGLKELLELLGRAVPPLMLTALGMSLSWQAWRVNRIPAVSWVLLIQLALQPLLVFGLASAFGLQGEVFQAVVLEAAMPTMVFGIVLCDRFGLDTGLFASLVTLTTMASVVSVPVWYHLLSGTP